MSRGFDYRMKNRQRGDTLVEVVIAMAVLGLVVAATMATMNQNLSSIMNTAERTVTRTKINSQVEMLHYLHENEPQIWKDLIDGKHLHDSKSGGAIVASNPCQATNNKSFVLSMNTTNNYVANDDVVKASFYERDKVFNGVDSEVYKPTATIGGGIFIDGVVNRSEKYIDFYVKACWIPYGGKGNDEGVVSNPAKSRTVVRIYDSILERTDV